MVGSSGQPRLTATGERDTTKNDKVVVVKLQQENLKTRIRTIIETIEIAVGNNAVEQMLKDVGTGITELKGLFQVGRSPQSCTYHVLVCDSEKHNSLCLMQP